MSLSFQCAAMLERGSPSSVSECGGFIISLFVIECGAEG